MRPAQRPCRHGVRLGLRRGRRARGAGRTGADRARRRHRDAGPQLPGLQQHRRRLRGELRQCAQDGAARRRPARSGDRDGVAERRADGIGADRAGGAQPALRLYHLDRQRGGHRLCRFRRLSRRRCRDRGDPALSGGGPRSAGLPRRLPARPRQRQVGGDDPSGQERERPGGGAIAYRRAGRRSCDDARPSRTRRGRAGRDDGGADRPRRTACALSGAAGQGRGHRHLLGRLLRDRP